MVFINIKDSFVCIMCVLVWNLYFAAFGEFLFANSMQGMMMFDNISDAFYAMFICFTTENYPDVMLMAQEKNVLYTLYFAVYIFTASFYLEAVLLAVIFENFKANMEII